MCGGVPPFITGLRNLLDDAAGWMLYLVPVAIVVIVISTGFKMYQNNDPHEVKEIKAKGFRGVIITGIIGSATWISNYVWGLFS